MHVTEDLFGRSEVFKLVIHVLYINITSLLLFILHSLFTFLSHVFTYICTCFCSFKGGFWLGHDWKYLIHEHFTLLNIYLMNLKKEKLLKNVRHYPAEEKKMDLVSFAWLLSQGKHLSANRTTLKVSSKLFTPLKDLGLGNILKTSILTCGVFFCLTQRLARMSERHE